MAHMQENPQNAGKNTRMPAAGETRQMPLRVDRPAQTAQAPYPLQGRPAPMQQVATPFVVSSGNGGNAASAAPGGRAVNTVFAAPGASGMPGANGVAAAEAALGANAANVKPGANGAAAAEAAEAAEAEEASKRKGLGGLLEGLSVPQVAAGALAAVTSMLLSSKIGIAGSVIGVAVGSVVSTVASQVYKQFLQASADKLRELNPLDEVGASAAADETRVMPTAGEGSSATRVMGAMPASGAAAAFGDSVATDDPAAKAVLADIRDEEKAHMGELITLMRHLDPTETEFFLEGEGEVQEKLAELGIKTDGEIAPAPAEPAPAPTVGDLS